MKKNAILFAAAALILTATSCMTAFSPSLRKEFSNNNIEMDEIQFYNSGKIELVREVKTNEVKASKGSYLKEKNYLDETVIFNSYTPGGFIGEDGDIIKISFDENDDSKFLSFKLNGSKYVLNSSKGKINYNGNVYDVISGEEVYISINADKNEHEREREIEVKGRRVVKKNKTAEEVIVQKKKPVKFTK